MTERNLPAREAYDQFFSHLIKYSTFRNYAARGVLPCTKILGKLYFNAEEMKAFVQKTVTHRGNTGLKYLEDTGRQ